MDSPIDPTQKIDQSQVQPTSQQPPPPSTPDDDKFKPPGAGDDDDDKDKNIDLNNHPFAKYFVDNWGWSVKDAMKAEDNYFKMIEQQCARICNKYKNIYKQLSPDYEENQ